MQAHGEGRVIRPPSNSAWRCRQFVLSTLTYANQHVDVAYAAALGIQPYEPDNPDHQDLVRAAITSLRKQQRAVLGALSQHPSITPDLFAPIEAANTALAGMHNIKQVLTNFPQLCSGEYVLALGWAANVLPGSGHSASDTEIAQILNDIISLKARLTSMRFPPSVYAFMEQLLKELEEGIVTASFEGIDSLHRACRNAVSEIADATEQLRAAEPNLNEEQSSYLSEAADKVEKVGKIAGGLSAAIDFTVKLVPLIGTAITAVSGS
jgi:hypothetical protein